MVLISWMVGGKCHVSWVRNIHAGEIMSWIGSGYRGMMGVYMRTSIVWELRNVCVWNRGFTQLDAWTSVGVYHSCMD